MVVLALTRVPSATLLSGASLVPNGFDGKDFLPVADMPLSASTLPLKNADAHRGHLDDAIE